MGGVARDGGGGAGVMTWHAWRSGVVADWRGWSGVGWRQWGWGCDVAHVACRVAVVSGRVDGHEVLCGILIVEFSPPISDFRAQCSSPLAFLSVPHLRAALATQARRVPDPGGHSYEVSRRADACATICNHSQSTDLAPSPNIAALARGSSPSTPTRPRPPRTRIRPLAPRGGLRDTSRRFTPPRPCATLTCITGVVVAWRGWGGTSWGGCGWAWVMMWRDEACGLAVTQRGGGEMAWLAVAVGVAMSERRKTKNKKKTYLNEVGSHAGLWAAVGVVVDLANRVGGAVSGGPACCDGMASGWGFTVAGYWWWRATS
ncbi:hypothetical protein EDB84DRAFT_1443081 [Lactarius hengduanensis]|nr:hypothetical protein EDB84DRAFT_1443081 [Lactarius hengduanensis]